MKRLDLMNDRHYVSTAQVAGALGVSVTTVKRWVDDAVLPAHRTVGGHRKLLLSDVARLVREGDLPAANLGRLDRSMAKRRVADSRRLTESLAAALRAGHGASVQSIIHGAYQGGMSIEQVADEVIAPAMAMIGHEWETGGIEVMHEHRGTQLVASAIFELKARIDQHAQRQRPVAVGGAIEGDHYLLPTLLAQTALLDAGWEAVNLGPNTPFTSMERAIVELRPTLIWVSVSYLRDSDQFESQYRRFFAMAKASGVSVIIGGRALPENIRKRLLYTSYGDGLRHLIALARTLHSCPRRPKRGRPFKAVGKS